jgi:putative transposase
MRAKTGISERWACALIGRSRTVMHYQATPETKNVEVRARMMALAEERRRFGYRRIHVMLRREGQCVNVKRLYRLYRLERLQVQRRRKRHGVAVEQRPLTIPQAPNQVWSIDFVSDSLETGRRLKLLTIVDDFTKEAIESSSTKGSPASTSRGCSIPPRGSATFRRRSGRTRDRSSPARRWMPGPTPAGSSCG